MQEIQIEARSMDLSPIRLAYKGSLLGSKATGGLSRGGAGSGSLRNVIFLKRVMHFSREF